MRFFAVFVTPWAGLVASPGVVPSRFARLPLGGLERTVPVPVPVVVQAQSRAAARSAVRRMDTGSVIDNLFSGRISLGTTGIGKLRSFQRGSHVPCIILQFHTCRGRL